MIKQHKDLQEVSEDEVLWQYMPLSKFMSLIKRGELYLNRVDNFKDKRECTLTAIDKKIFVNVDNDYWEKDKKRYFISCWVKDKNELALMWDTYGKDGVAIQTTARDMKACMATDKSNDVYMSYVKYIDDKIESSQDAGTPKNLLKIPFTKRLYYTQEQEVRLLYCDNEGSMKEKTGMYLPIAPQILLDKVIVYPGAPEYFLEIVNDVLENNGIDIKAVKSQI